MLALSYGTATRAYLASTTRTADKASRMAKVSIAKYNHQSSQAPPSHQVKYRQSQATAHVNNIQPSIHVSNIQPSNHVSNIKSQATTSTS